MSGNNTDSDETERIKTIPDLTCHGGIDPRSYLGYAWDVVDGEVGQDWLKEFGALRDGRIDVFCDSCGELVHMGHDEPDGVWVRINRKAVCAECILTTVLGGSDEYD